MHREQLIKHWDVIEAYKNGAKIEYQSRNSWYSANYPAFGITTTYRVKPEPKYVPYETWEEAKHLVGKIVEYTYFKDTLLITKVDFTNGKLNINDRSAAQLLNNYTLLDGTPIGKLVE